MLQKLKPDKAEHVLGSETHANTGRVRQRGLVRWILVPTTHQNSAAWQVLSEEHRRQLETNEEGVFGKAKGNP